MSQIQDSDIAEFLKETKDHCTIRDSEIRNALDFLINKKNYVSQRFLGAGSFGIVVQATDRYNNVYAIKIIISNQTGPIKDAESEAKFIKDVKSPYVVKYIEHFINLELKSFFLVTEYCAGGSIKDLHSGTQKITQEQTIQYILQILYGIRDLHNNNVIHCDLKPDNVLISNEGKLKICDLGLSRQVSVRNAYASKLGNLLYMPPEGLTTEKNDKGQIQISYSYDLFSIGGLMIFTCDHNLESKIALIKQNKIPNFAGHPNEKILNIALTMMVDKPSDRATINDVISQLEPMLKKLVANSNTSANSNASANSNPGGNANPGGNPNPNSEDFQGDDQREDEELGVYLERKLNETFDSLFQQLNEMIPD